MPLTLVNNSPEPDDPKGVLKMVNYKPELDHPKVNNSPEPDNPKGDLLLVNYQPVPVELDNPKGVFTPSVFQMNGISPRYHSPIHWTMAYIA